MLSQPQRKVLVPAYMLASPWRPLFLVFLILCLLAPLWAELHIVVWEEWLDRWSGVGRITFPDPSLCEDLSRFMLSWVHTYGCCLSWRKVLQKGRETWETRTLYMEPPCYSLPNPESPMSSLRLQGHMHSGRMAYNWLRWVAGYWCVLPLTQPFCCENVNRLQGHLILTVCIDGQICTTRWENTYEYPHLGNFSASRSILPDIL